MLWVSTPSVFAYYSGAIRIGSHTLSWLLRKTAITKFTVVKVICFIRAVGVDVSNLFLQSGFRALRNAGRLHPSKEVLISLSRNMKAYIMEQGLRTAISDCEVDHIIEFLAYAQMNKLDWSDIEASGWYLYDFATVIKFEIPECEADGAKRGRDCDALPCVVHPKVVL